MGSRLPDLFAQHKICVICEGGEEFDYLTRLKELKVWKEQYLIELVDAGGNGNIFARYQDRYQNDTNEVVLVFCDTENKTSEQYEDIKRKINEFHGLPNAAEEVVIFGNPCTMQIILAHWADEKLNTQAKKVNGQLIEQYTGVKGYKARSDQREQVMQCVTAKNYADMLRRVRAMSTDDTVAGSTNFEKMLRCFESEDAAWIEEINRRLEY